MVSSIFFILLSCLVSASRKKCVGGAKGATRIGVPGSRQVVFMGGVVGAGAAATSPSGARVGGAQGVGSTVDSCARGGMEFEDVLFGPRSKAIILAMLAAIRSIVPWSIATLPTSAAT
ncbi:hypothetical protein CRG98_029780 [Punica granatum]|uniref:Secreted protein n=1 Tax=Punica granatum TaxID=22663 RepID=A0A2I0J1B4_PUNGR|nr:hypothetical protein CRG98_029780 [Punica granatum]